MDRESKSLEYKVAVSKTYLKTVSAFANYGDGEIVFGIDDEYRVVGIKDIREACLSIENQINDSIDPKPDFLIRINDNETISLLVKKGPNTPYKYNGKSYKRNDSSTIEAGQLENKRLIIEGMNLTFEEIKSNNQILTFNVLKENLIKKLNLESFDLDTLKSMNLYRDRDGYNNAAQILADKNSFPGIDIIVFGDDINEIKNRYTFANESIIKEYFDSLEVFKANYISEVIEDGVRKKNEKIPFNAYREALANSIIHRTYDVKANGKIEMHNDKIVISSPGGLMEGMNEEQYLKGSFSLLRNPIIANVFYRLGIIEMFATGIKRINESYKGSLAKPIFDIDHESIKITLPVIKNIEITTKEKTLLDCMQNNLLYKRTDLEKATKINKDSLLRLLNSLIDKGLIERSGNTNNSSYAKTN